MSEPPLEKTAFWPAPGDEPVAASPSQPPESKPPEPTPSEPKPLEPKPPEPKPPETQPVATPFTPWRSAIAPLDYGIAVAVALLVAHTAGAQTLLPMLANLPGSHKPFDFETGALLGAAREALLQGFALGLLALRAHRRGSLPGFLECYTAAFVTGAAGLAAAWLPLPWGPQNGIFQRLPGNTAAIAVAASGCGLGIVGFPRAFAYWWSLGAQREWSSGVKLMAPTELLGAALSLASWAIVSALNVKPATTVDLGQSALLGATKGVLVTALVGVALPLLVKWVPVGVAALGIHTGSDPERNA